MRRFLGLVLASTLVQILVWPAAADELAGTTRLPANVGPVSERSMDLFLGDLGAEIGIGCSNGSGTSGGPNDFALGPFLGPYGFGVAFTSVFYHVFTNVSPTLTALSFKVWQGTGLVPGAELASHSGLDFSLGEHTAVLPWLDVDADWFFFGLAQPQTDAALRIGLDTSSGGGENSFLRAPGCGLENWGTMTSVGFSGNWVIMGTIEQGGGVPIELTSWGELKSTFRR